MRRSPTTLALLVVAAVMVAAVAIAVVPGGREPTPTASPVAPAGLVAENVPPPGTALPIGRYAIQDFLPRVTFEIDGAGWSNVEWGQGSLHLRTAGGDTDGVGLRFARPTAVYSTGLEPVPATTAADAARALGRIDVARLVGSSDSRMDGHRGSVVELEHTARSDAVVAVLQLPGEDRAVTILPGRHLWIALFDTPEGLLAIVVDASADAADRDLALVEPILESVTIGR